MSIGCGSAEDGFKNLMEKDGTFGASGMLWGVSCGGSIGKMDGLCVSVEMWESMFFLSSGFG